MFANYKNLLFFFFKLFSFKEICLINSPSQLLCLNELIFLNKKQNKILILIGYPSDTSLNQIRSLILDLPLSNKTIFLIDLMNEQQFATFLKFFKFFLVFKKSIIGDFNYYLSKGIYKYTKKTIFLDEGINVLNIDDKDIKKKFSFFSIFENISKKTYKKNNYGFLKNIISSKKIKNDNIYLLGTSDASPKISVLNEKLYFNLIRNFCYKFKEKNVFFIPHRNEPAYKIEELKISNLNIKKINKPIEYVLAKSDYLPNSVFGFYTMGLINLKILFNKSGVNVVNINYNLNTLDDKNLCELYKKYQKLFNQLGIEEINLNNS